MSEPDSRRSLPTVRFADARGTDRGAGRSDRPRSLRGGAAARAMRRAWSSPAARRRAFSSTCSRAARHSTGTSVARDADRRTLGVGTDDARSNEQLVRAASAARSTPRRSATSCRCMIARRTARSRRGGRRADRRAAAAVRRRAARHGQRRPHRLAVSRRRRACRGARSAMRRHCVRADHAPERRRCEPAHDAQPARALLAARADRRAHRGRRRRCETYRRAMARPRCARDCPIRAVLHQTAHAASTSTGRPLTKAAASRRRTKSPSASRAEPRDARGLSRPHRRSARGRPAPHASRLRQPRARLRRVRPTADKAALRDGNARQHRHRHRLQRHAVGPSAARERYPDIIKDAARAVGGTAQVAGGVPAMCDGVTQGQPGMELSLFSRDVIAHGDGGRADATTCSTRALCLGICDKIVPGLLIGALAFGHLPAIFVPAGPMPSGIPNEEKARIREALRRGQVGRDELLEARGRVLSRGRHLHLLRHRQLQPDADGDDGPAPAGRGLRQSRTRRCAMR